jgi:hypothetical protein
MSAQAKAGAAEEVASRRKPGSIPERLERLIRGSRLAPGSDLQVAASQRLG